MVAPVDLPNTSALRRLWHQAAGHRGTVVWASTCSVLNKLFDLAPPLLIGLAVDVVANDSSSFLERFGAETGRAQLVVLSILTFIVWALESLFEYLYGIAWRNLAQDIQHELRTETYDQLQDLENAWFEDKSTGDLLAVLNDDVNQLERFLDVGANDMIQTATTVLAIGGIFFWIAPQVAWWSFLPIPLVIWGSLWFQKRLEPRYADVRNQAGFLNAQLANNLLGISTIKSFVAEDRESARVAEESDRYRTRNAEAIRLSSAFIPLIRMAILIGFTGTLLYGGFLALEGDVLSIGEYSVMVFLTQRLLWPLTALGETFDLYQRGMASTNRILDVLDTQPTIVGGDTRLHVERGAGTIVFDRVEFSYDDHVRAIDGITLEIPAARTTAIVGPTGSGKSTLVKLLLRFHDPDAGEIRLEGVPLPRLDLRDLRAATGLVSQDVYLFHGTVRENIAYGAPGASFEDIAAAARVAEADEFIRGLPHGYDTIVGERGQKLSGGQRQRLSIARAVLKDPPILLLDEATSAVDNETEAAIQRSLERLSANRTTIVIAHRLSTVRHADRIHALVDGRIVESGTHEELLLHDAAYAGLWKVQTGEAVAHHTD